MLSNSLIFVVINVMLLMPMYPISRHIKLDMKARRNHRPNDVRYSGFAVVISSLKNTLAQRYNFYQFSLTITIAIRATLWHIVFTSSNKSANGKIKKTKFCYNKDIEFRRKVIGRKHRSIVDGVIWVY
jgi:hypothetical protein